MITIKSKHTCAFAFLIISACQGTPAKAADVTMDRYLLQLSVGNGETNDFGPSLMDNSLPFETEQQFSQAPSSGLVQYMLQSFDQLQTMFETNNSLSVGRAGNNDTPRASNLTSIEIRPQEPVLVAFQAQMNYDLPSAFMTATSSIGVANLDLNESVGGGPLKPGVSFDGDPAAGTSLVEFDDLYLEPGYLYRLSYRLTLTALTDQIGPVGTATGFGRFTFQSVPEPGMGAMVLLGGVMMLRRRRR